jgi:DNA transposition AAA+ family ATPase
MNAPVTLLKPSAEARDLRAEVAALQAEDTKLTQAEISRQSGVGSTALSQWINGRYPGDNDKLESDLARWVDAYHTRRLEARALPQAPAWVETPTGGRVLAALGYAQLAGDIAIVYGGAGLGKTTTIEQYRRSSPNVWIATMSPCTASAVPALEEVAEVLGIEVSGGAAKLQRAIVKRLRGTMGLLIIDEAQHLSVAALDAMRALHDATGLGLALVGNESVYARMTGGNRAAYLDRLFSRIGKRVRLTRSTKGDIDALIDAWNLSVRECRPALHDIASKPGGLRGMTKVLRLASLFAAGAGRPVNCDDIMAAWRDLGGE